MKFLIIKLLKKLFRSLGKYEFYFLDKEILFNNLNTNKYKKKKLIKYFYQNYQKK